MTVNSCLNLENPACLEWTTTRLPLFYRQLLRGNLRPDTNFNIIMFAWAAHSTFRRCLAVWPTKLISSTRLSRSVTGHRLLNFALRTTPYSRNASKYIESESPFVSCHDLDEVPWHHAAEGEIWLWALSLSPPPSKELIHFRLYAICIIGSIVHVGTSVPNVCEATWYCHVSPL